MASITLPRTEKTWLRLKIERAMRKVEQKDLEIYYRLKTMSEMSYTGWEYFTLTDEDFKLIDQ
jgi:hypothetical protein